MNNSVILSFLFSVFMRLKNWLAEKSKNSFFCNLFRKLVNGFDSGYAHSFLVNAVADSEHTDSAYEQRYGKISKSIRKFFTQLLGFTVAPIHNSRFVHAFNLILINFVDYPIRIFGAICFSAGLGGFVHSLVLQDSRLAFCFAGALLVVGFFMLLIPYSISELLETSFFVNFVGIRTVGERCSLSIQKYFLYSGLCFAGSLIFGALPLIFTIGLTVATAFIFKYTAVALVIYITVLPFMPTMVMVAGVLGILAIFAVKTLTSGKKVQMNYSSVNLFVFLMAVLFCWGVVNSFSRMSSLKSVMVYLAFMSVYYLIINIITDKEKLFSAFKCILWASVICSLAGIYQYFNPEGLSTWQDTEMFENISGRIVSFFENPNVYGEYLILIIMITLAMVISAKSAGRKTVYFIALALSGICLILTYSRGCWLGIIAAVAVFLFIRHRNWFLAAIVVGCVAIFFLPSSIITRFMSIGNLADSSTSYRVYIWEGTLSMLKDFWVTGIGVGTEAFNHLYPIYSYNAISAPHPHNLYLLLVTEQGIVGLVIFLLLILFLFKKLFVVANHSKTEEYRTYAAALLSALVGFLLQGMFDNVWYNYRVFLFFWIIIGLSSALCIIDKKAEVRK